MNLKKKESDKNMGTISSAFTTIVGIAKEATKDEHIMKSLLGTYSNGDVRSIPDMISGELVSPEDRLLITERMKKIEKKRKKSKKKKRKDHKNNAKSQKKKKKKHKSNDHIIMSYFN